MSFATSTTPEKPLSACARTIASSRSGVCAVVLREGSDIETPESEDGRSAGKRSRSNRTGRLFIRILPGKSFRVTYGMTASAVRIAAVMADFA
ncbi:MAG TPA: hypothetical protein VK571_09405 [Gemmatimonadaceae bacterium]|nr:hypothetical protein [Gemmatimonadaceae bacterium]